MSEVIEPFNRFYTMKNFARRYSSFKFELETDVQNGLSIFKVLEKSFIDNITKISAAL